MGIQRLAAMFDQDSFREIQIETTVVFQNLATSQKSGKQLSL